MKDSRNQENRQSKQGFTNVPKPEIRDNLDSRKNEEQRIKGGDITNNKKNTKNKDQRDRQ